jgi:NAD(P)H-dependent FMN reductase
MLSRIAEGWQYGGGPAPEVLHLARQAHFERAVEAYPAADVVLLGMPLYTDSMPALVKLFIENLAPCAASTALKTLAFLVQSGFPEAAHSRLLERYLKKLTVRLGCIYAGTIVRGGGEALQMMPDEANKKLWAQLRTLGEQLARQGAFAEKELKRIAGMERLPKWAAPLTALAAKLPIVQFYWNSKLKKNGAWSQRFAAPYAPKA